MKITREERAAAKLWIRDVELAMRAKVKKCHWKKSRETLFYVESDYFYYCDFFPNGISNNVDIRLWCKPLGLDPIFWEIFKIPENLKKPISHRSHAAFKCFGVKIDSCYLKFEKDQSPDSIVNAVIEYIDELTQKYIAENFDIPFEQQLIDHGDTLSISLVCAKILNGNLSSAKEIVNQAIQSQVKGPYGVIGSDKNFYDYAYEWLKMKPQLTSQSSRPPSAAAD